MSNFKELKGQIIKSIVGLEKDSAEVIFETDAGRYIMYHSEDCCEDVSIEDVIGDVDDLIGSQILLAEKIESNKNPDGIEKEFQDDSFTWTFYKLSTIKGSVTIRWYGESNGYYSESVDFEKTEEVKNERYT
jgi:hypothetical protein